MKRFISMMLSVVMVISGYGYDFSGLTNVYAAKNTEIKTDNITESQDISSANEYGLADNVADGVILHAWNWSFSQIMAELPNIAEAGYTAIQTSPIQRNKEGDNVPDTSAWWKFYQPTNFEIGNKLGTRDQFKQLCTEAHKYGIKIVVDVVANHLANVNGSDGNAKSNRSSEIPDNIRNNDAFWHNDNYSGSSDTDRYQMTHAPIGMPDLNTSNTELQDIILNFLSDAQACGADGFRFDAAKHIETPSDNGFGSQFWARVKETTQKNNPDVFLYGEILNTAGPGGYSDMQKYTPYIRVTNNKYANNMRAGIKNRNADSAKFTNNDIFGSNGNEWVLWNESHDTYAGDYGENTDAEFDDEEMALAWCVVASRTSPALYFSRPIANKGDGAWKGAALGQHTSMYKDVRIAAMNKFHNYFAGQTEYVTTSDNVLVVERGTTGVALVNFNRGSKSVNIKVNKMADGTYKDQVTGSEFKVSNGTLTGNIGSGGVAAVYNPGPVILTPVPTISKEGGNFTTDTLELTLGFKNATSGTYKIGNGDTKTYTSGTKVTIGADMSYGDSVTITLTATDGTQTSEPKTFTFTKVEQTGNVAYFSIPSGWSEPVYCYAYDSATEKVSNGEWPGVQMTKDSATGYYVYEIPENIEKPRVIFYSSDTNRTPADMIKGYLFEEECSYLYKDGTWAKYEPVVEKGTVTVKYVDESGKEIKTATTMTGKVGSAYTTSAADIEGYEVSTTPANASGTYTKAAITVTYVYKVSTDDGIKITSSVADGETFTTETKTITITTKNATSATYSVDDGPAKSFSGSADVVIGQGKIADREVTVKVTASNDTNTETKTFTYNKKFSGKTVNEQLSAASGLSVAMQLSKAGNAFASDYYSVNKTGKGSEKTITSASDWTASELIAQGVANDDSNVFKGPHEYPVYDEYGLYAAYDDKNVYIGWQFVNVRDVVAPDQRDAGTNEAKPYNADIPQILLFDLGKSNGAYSDGSMDTKDSDRVWGMKLDYETNINAVMCFSSKPEAGTPALFTTNSNGKFSYDKEYCRDFKSLGISFKYEDGLFAGISNLYGIKKNAYTGLTTDMLLSNSSEWEDLLPGHKTTLDTMYTMTIPYEALGVTKEYVKNNRIGIMHLSTYGLSGIACIPNDESMYDNATEAYLQDPSSTREKEDTDVITASLAKLGGGDNPDPVDDLTLNFGADRSAPQLNTTQLKLEAIAAGGQAPYTYEFYVDGKSVQAASSASTYTWTPTVGNHTIKATVKDAAGTELSSQKTYTIEGEDDYQKPVVSTFKADKASATEGDTVKLTATATGGDGTLQYEFTAVAADGTKEVIKAYSNAASADWSPKAGTYTVKVTVKDGKGNTATKEITGYNVEKQGTALNITDVVTDKASGDAVVGNTVKITAKATGEGTLQYRFTYILQSDDEDGDEVEETIQDYSQSASADWALTEAGTYTIKVYVKDANGNAKNKTIDNYIVNPKSYVHEIKINSFTADKTSGSVKVGESIKLTADVTSTEAVTYKYVAQLGEKQTVIKDYSDNTSVTWKPDTAGKYVVWLYVRDANANTVNKSFEFEVKAKEDPTQPSSDNPTQPSSDNPTQPSSDNPTQPSSEDPTQPSSEDPTQPSSEDPTQPSSEDPTQPSSEDPTKPTDEKTISINSFKADKNSNTAMVGQKVTLTADATGGKGTLKYKFVVKPYNKYVVTVRGYKESNSCTWIPAVSGKYTLYVYVKDENGTVVKKTVKAYTVAKKLKVSSLKTSAKSRFAYAGSKIILSAKATGGIGGKFYKFYYKLNGKTYVIRNYSEVAKTGFIPKKAGKYELYVAVTDDLGNTAKKRISNYVINKQLQVKYIKANKKNIKVGDTIKINTSAKGGYIKKSYKYRITVKNNGRTKVLKNYTSSSSVKWKATKKGTYTFKVYVKDSNGKKVSKSVTYVVK